MQVPVKWYLHCPTNSIPNLPNSLLLLGRHVAEEMQVGLLVVLSMPPTRSAHGLPVLELLLSRHCLVEVRAESYLAYGRTPTWMTTCKNWIHWIQEVQP
jgi:hypothetical protein